MKWIVILALLVPGALACVVPTDNMQIAESAEFCADVYYLDNGIHITSSDVTLDCAGAVLKSWNGGKGISIEHVENVTVKRCRVLHYQNGIYVRNSSSVFLLDNHLIHNQEGTRFVVVTDSATFNHDVSLVKPITVLESRNNVISFSNRVVSGSFCKQNYCNKQQKVIEHAMIPEATLPELKSWLSNTIGGKTPQRLYNWLVSGLTGR